VTTAEYIARLKMQTQGSKSRVINLIYGLDGMVVGNADELLKVAEMLLEDRDRLQRHLALGMEHRRLLEPK
jgi:hypothetical protein